MRQRHDSLVVQTLSRVLIPLIQLYSFYVLLHGQFGPGGGFVAGVLFGTSLILSLLVFGDDEDFSVIQRFAFHWDGGGLLLFVGIGLVCIGWGGEFLDYGALPIPGLDPAAVRSVGIVSVQVGIGLDVSVAAASIFYSLSHPQGEGNHDA